MKTEVKQSLTKRLEKEQKQIRYSLFKNKTLITKLSKESTIFKRELFELDKLIKQLRTQ